MCILACIWIDLRAPTYHEQALQLFDDVLSESPCDRSAILGKSKILRFREEPAAALSLVSLLSRSRPRDCGVLMEVIRCEIDSGCHRSALQKLQFISDDLDLYNSQTAAIRSVIWQLIGECQTSTFSESPGTAYASLIRSLKYDATNADTYTLLGRFYEAFRNDTHRANKCYQKAFELDFKQIFAAERLAEQFSFLEEWELVEVIALRACMAPICGRNPKNWPQRALGLVYLV